MAATKMVNLSIEETSGVDHPAHLAEGWVILKHADRRDVAATIAALAHSQENISMADETTIEKDADTTVEVETPVVDELEKAHARIAELEAALAEIQKSADPEDEDETGEEAILKAAPAAVRELLEKARIEADTARAELQKARDEQADREYIAKAKGWAHLSLDAEAFGPMLRRLFDLDPTIGEVIEKALTAADAQAESGAIFTEIGKSAPVIEGGDAYGRVQSLAKAAVEAGEYPTVEQAVAGLIVKNPSLYSDYLASRD